MTHAFSWAKASRKIFSALGFVAEQRSPLRDRKEFEGDDDEHRSKVPALAGRKVAGAHCGDASSRHTV
ncbi:hypothetical protein [Paraburkholderia ultramafica]|uniref:hypothetical protein n=1 Tax=Paraburkholderia ultramafica TaxID=1544867 RepID=UPI001581C72F|nr:hypothetical protein [Paraburkholderia ultramafica]